MITLLMKHRTKSLFFLAFIIAYVLQLLIPSPDKYTLSHYHLSVGGAKLLGLSVALPYIVIWVIALVGFLRLKTYTDTIAESKDGVAFATVAKGIWLLVLWLPLSTLFSGFSAEYYHAHPSATGNLIRLNNYLTLLLLLTAFWLLYRGSTQLLRLIKTPSYTLYQPTTLLYMVFAPLYTYLVLQDTVRNHPRGSTLSSYYSPDWVILLTLVIPRLIMWYLGLQAVQNILLYRRRVKGSLYRQALKRLAQGVGGVIITLILLRILQSLSDPLGKLSLLALLVAIYVLLILFAIGYVLISQGARKLQKIEEL